VFPEIRLFLYDCNMSRPLALTPVPLSTMVESLIRTFTGLTLPASTGGPTVQPPLRVHLRTVRTENLDSDVMVMKSTEDRRCWTQAGAVKRRLECPLWVISGHFGQSTRCPLYPRKRTCAVHKHMSAKGQKRTSISCRRCSGHCPTVHNLLRCCRSWQGVCC
jgi:hypothetical protein